MQQSPNCPRCGRAVRYIPEYQQWYCDYCRLYPFIQPVAISPPYYYQPMPRHDTADLAIKIIAGIILLLIIGAFIFIAILLTNLPPINGDVTPTGTLNFDASLDNPGEYTGNFIAITDIIDLRDASLVILDESLATSAVLDPLADGGIAIVPGGINCTFNDVDGDDLLDTIDTFTIQNGDAGDVITIVYNPTGETIASYTLG